MKVSVIIPVFNRPREVAEAIRCALGQTMPPLEILVVDDGSTDDTAAAVERFGPPVRLIRQENQGPAAARNRAAKEAAGEWIAFLDSDDLWLPEKLAREAGALEQSQAGLVHADGWVITGHDLPPWAAALLKWETGSDGRPASDERPPPPPTHFSRFTPANGPGALVTYLNNPVLTSSVMVRRDAFDRAGGFDESFAINEDADLFVRVMALGHEAVYVARPLVFQRVMPDGIPRDWMFGLREAIHVQKKALAAFPALRPVFREALASSHRSAAQCALVQSTKSDSIRFWLRSFLYRRPSWKELAVAVLLIAGGAPGRDRVLRHWKNRVARYQK
ncbi:MAG TPA: glycosyltransferase family A protein [bacterium]|nr:glycosyltransferase family A protein [bacterium]